MFCYCRWTVKRLTSNILFKWWKINSIHLKTWLSFVSNSTPVSSTFTRSHGCISHILVFKVNYPVMAEPENKDDLNIHNHFGGFISITLWAVSWMFSMKLIFEYLSQEPLDNESLIKKFCFIKSSVFLGI